jgi:hypothetical protein
MCERIDRLCSKTIHIVLIKIHQKIEGKQWISFFVLHNCLSSHVCRFYKRVPFSSNYYLTF